MNEPVIRVEHLSKRYRIGKARQRHDTLRDVVAASLRFVAALLSWAAVGLGFLWQLWDRDRLTWHDRISGTRIVHYPKPGKG